MNIIIENIRSFASRIKIPLRSMTILLGENSAGKTSFLAALSSVLDSSKFPGRLGFNDPPYDLGTYDTIATYKGGRFGRAESFSLGIEIEADKKLPDRTVIATYKNHAGEPILKAYDHKSGGRRLFLDTDSNHIEFDTGEGQTAKDRLDADAQMLPGAHSGGPWFVLNFLYSAMMRGAQGAPPKKRVDLFRQIEKFMFEVRERGAESRPPVSIAPIRTKPQRTYDELSEEFSPEGTHIPVILARRIAQGESPSDSSDLMRILEEFGKNSGLFTKLGVKRLGRKASDPFQLIIGTSGRSVNLKDVGYGVSQSLPVVVQSCLVGPGRMLLLQQPEVHLHPRAQAALGSFFAGLLVERKNQFVIETHSDFLVDRIRHEISSGRISHDSVLILYFRKNKHESEIHPIELDERGNLLNVPEGYRSFFLEEEEKLFGGK